MIVPDDVLIRPYDLQADGGIGPSDRLLVPYAKYVELWNRGAPGQEIVARQAAAAAIRLGRGVLHHDPGGDRACYWPGEWRSTCLPRGMRSCRWSCGAGFLCGGARRQARPGPPRRLFRGAAAESGAAERRVAVLFVEGKGRHSLEIEIQVKLSRQGGWRVAEAALPVAPATSLAITAPAAGTEIRLSEVRDRRGYETEQDGETIHTTLGGSGELALQWRPKVAEGQVDRGLTSQSAAVLDVQEDGLRLIWDLSLEFRRSQRERFFVHVPRKFLVEKVSGGNVRGWEVRKTDKEQTVEVSLLKSAKDRERFALQLWRSGAVGQGELAEFDAPLVSAAGVAQAGGELTICRSPLLDLRTVRSGGAARADTSGDLQATATESPLGLRPYQAYRFAAMPFVVRLAAAPLAAKTTAEVQTLLRLSRYERTMESRVLLHVQDRPIHRIELFLPEESTCARSWPGRISMVRRRAEQTPAAVDLPRRRAARRAVRGLRGTLGKPGEARGDAVAGVGSLRRRSPGGRHRRPRRSGLRRRGPGLARLQGDGTGAGHSVAQSTAVADDPLGTALRAAGLPRPAAAFPRKPDMSCETISDVCVTDRAIKETILLSFEVREAGIREFRSSCPGGWPTAASASPCCSERTSEPVDTSPDSPVRVRIELQDEVMGQIRVLVENDRLPTPGVHARAHPRGGDRADQPAMRRLEEPAATSCPCSRPSDSSRSAANQGQWRELTAALRSDVTLAYMVSAGGRRRGWNSRPCGARTWKWPGRASAWRRRSWCSTPTGPIGPRRPSTRTTPPSSFSRIALPAGAVLWTVVVAGEPVKPVGAATGEQVTPCGKGPSAG